MAENVKVCEKYQYIFWIWSTSAGVTSVCRRNFFLIVMHQQTNKRRTRARPGPRMSGTGSHCSQDRAPVGSGTPAGTGDNRCSGTLRTPSPHSMVGRRTRRRTTRDDSPDRADACKVSPASNPVPCRHYTRDLSLTYGTRSPCWFLSHWILSLVSSALETWGDSVGSRAGPGGFRSISP